MQQYVQWVRDRLPHVRLAVIGDLMLDCYLHGDVSRISPEAPVPVMRAESERAVAGGAANVAANAAALGAEVHVVGVCGRDVAHEQLVSCLTALGRVDTAGIVLAPGRRTTRKLRVIGGQQQIVRIDHEDLSPCSTDVEEACVIAARAAIDAADVVVLSDYGKGVCSDRVLQAAIAHARDTGKQTIVDPKRRDFAAYRGASVLTPNRKELSDATGMPCETDEEAAAAAAVAQHACGADILLTRSEKGMSYFPVHGDPRHLTTMARDVFDVSGAGDTVVAVFAAALGAGAPVVDAMRLANHAAGIVVSKMGTAVLTRDELAAAISSTSAPTLSDDGGLITSDEAASVRWRWAHARLTVGIVSGRFDMPLPHAVACIRQAALRCDRLMVALASDSANLRADAPALSAAELERAAVIGAIKGVAAVVPFEALALPALVGALQPDLHLTDDAMLLPAGAPAMA